MPTLKELSEAAVCLDKALECMDGLVTGVYDAMLDEDKELAHQLTQNIDRARHLLLDEGKSKSRVVEIFSEE